MKLFRNILLLLLLTSIGYSQNNLLKSGNNLIKIGNNILYIPFNQYSMLFDGVDESINTGTSSNLDQNDNDWTISLWIKTTSASGFIYSEGKDVADNNLIGIRVISSKAGLFVRNNANTNTQRNSTGNVNDGVWHNIIGTKIGDLYSLYLDGAFENSETVSLGNIPIEHTGIAVLARSTLGSYFTGNIDEVSIWKKGLSLTQAGETFNNRKPTNLLKHSAIADLVNWWRMGDKSIWDGTDFTLIDQKGNVDGTSVNMEFSDKTISIAD